VKKRLLLGGGNRWAGWTPPRRGDEHAPHQLYDVGTLGTIVRCSSSATGSVRVMVQGLERAAAQGHRAGEKWLMAETRAAAGEPARGLAYEALSGPSSRSFTRDRHRALPRRELHDVLADFRSGKTRRLHRANLISRCRQRPSCSRSTT